MTIRFELRTTKKAKGAKMVPLHISVSDGRAFRQRQVTNIMVNPEHWDVKAGDLKKRFLSIRLPAAIWLAVLSSAIYTSWSRTLTCSQHLPAMSKAAVPSADIVQSTWT